MQPSKKFKALTAEMQNVTATSVPVKHVIVVVPATAALATAEVTATAKRLYIEL